MTVEDRLSETLAARAGTAPPLPELYRNVRAQAVVVRRRRRATYAVVGTVVAVVAITAPFALQAGHDSEPRPSASTTGPASPSPLVSRTLSPPPPVVSVPAVPAPSRPATQPSNAPFVQPFESPPPLPASFPLGAAAELPIFAGDDAGFVVERHGVFSPRIALPYVNVGVSTPYGILIQSQRRLLLVHGDNSVTTVFTRAGIIAWTVRPDGRMVAWGTQVKHGKGNSETFSGEIGLLDLATGAVSDIRTTAMESEPTGFLADGRVTAAQGDGAVGGVIIWNPSTGHVTVPDLTARVIHSVAGDTYLLDSTSCSFNDDVTGRRVKAPCTVGASSPDGRRAFASADPWNPKVINDGTSTLVDVATGRLDHRLANLLKRKDLVGNNDEWIDDAHVELTATSWHPTLQAQDASWTLVLTCDVPLTGAVSCVRNQVFGPFVTGTGTSPLLLQPTLIPLKGQQPLTQ